MSANIQDTSAARGRIIKRGGIKPPLRPIEVPKTRGAASHAPPHNPPPPRSMRDPITLFIVIPILFCLSAAFSWSRPLETEGVSSASDAVTNHRFHNIGTQLSGRFSGEIAGRVVSPPAKSALKDNSQTAPVKAAPVSLPSNVSTTSGGTKRDALEKQVYKILKMHGKPTHNGKALASAIVKEALTQDYDPVFVAAVIKSESAFNALARSNKGAQGLMQIMPKTGAWLADQQKLPRGKLTDPGHNLKLGITYLKQLEAEYKGNRMLTLVAYNWGPGHVESAASGTRRVPGEVMQYAVKILNDYRRWSSELRSSVG